MDRRFLSQRQVINASRRFICVRMMTYENAAEAHVLKSLWRPGAALENTLFVLLDPYGRPITRGARSPDWTFANADDMAAGMNEIASSYQSRNVASYLPVVSSVRLAMNVAACDKRPLAIVVANSQEERRTLEDALAPLARESEFMGKMIYATGSRSELGSINGARISQGYLFVSPNEFGNAGEVIQSLGPSASRADLTQALKTLINRHAPLDLDHREHIRMGHQQGVRWTSALPITDPHELQAQHRLPPFGFHGGFGGPPPPEEF